MEARLGKPSHLLEGDKLRQFIANSGKVLRFWWVPSLPYLSSLSPLPCARARACACRGMALLAAPRSGWLCARSLAQARAYACPPPPPRRCVWDDRQGMYGDRRPYVLHFYLEDDTVEINEARGGVPRGPGMHTCIPYFH